MNIILGWLAGRAIEPSTWLGIGNIIFAATHKDWGGVVQAGAGVVGIVMPEGGKKK